MSKKPIGIDVLTAARERIAFAFDRCERVYLSFSGGKDSTVMLHLVMEEAQRRGQQIGVLLIDWECQFDLTINHAQRMFTKYAANIEPFWVCLPILTNNATSMYEPVWRSWDEAKRELWTRDKPEIAITDKSYFPFYYEGITFEEFVPLFGKWYSDEKDTACFVGIRTQESLNRYRAISRGDKGCLEGKAYTTNVVDNVWNVYPLYDWRVSDIWAYNGKFQKEYNTLYDIMYKAGLSPHQMRVDEPFGDEARKNLWLYQIIEPKTWAKMIARMNGVNSGALYSKEAGNVLGNLRVTLPPNHTWQSFAMNILESMPPPTAEHYKNKIAVYLKWYRDRGYPNGIPDAADYRLEQLGKVPAWRQVVKTLLRNDYWCRGLGFSITKSKAYAKYLELMRRRRKAWGIFHAEVQ